MKKHILLALIVLSFTMLILSGCAAEKNYASFRELTCNCIEKDERLLIELYEIYNNNSIEKISLVENYSETKVGTFYDYNDKKYYVVTFEGKGICPLSKDYQRAFDILDYLLSEYSIIFVDYYFSPGNMQFYYDDGYINVDWSIIYYPPGVVPEDALEEYERYEEIKDGFYTYTFFPGP